MNSFHLLEKRRKNSDYVLLPVATGFTMATVSHGLCVYRSEAGDPAGLRFSVTHNINHFIKVGQTVLEIHLKYVGTALAGGRHHAWEQLTKLVQQESAAAENFSELKHQKQCFHVRVKDCELQKNIQENLIALTKSTTISKILAFHLGGREIAHLTSSMAISGVRVRVRVRGSAHARGVLDSICIFGQSCIFRQIHKKWSENL